MRVVLLLGVEAAEQRLDAEGCEHTGRHASGHHLGVLADAGELIGGRAFVVAAERGEAVRVTGVVDDVGCGDTGSPVVAADLSVPKFIGEENELIGMGNGSGRSSTPSTIEKMAVVAPMPKASVRTAVREKPGNLERWRKAIFRSRSKAGSSRGKDSLQQSTCGAKCGRGETSCLSGWVNRAGGKLCPNLGLAVRIRTAGRSNYTGTY